MHLLRCFVHGISACIAVAATSESEPAASALIHHRIAQPELITSVLQTLRLKSAGKHWLADRKQWLRELDDREWVEMSAEMVSQEVTGQSLGEWLVGRLGTRPGRHRSRTTQEHAQTR